MAVRRSGVQRGEVVDEVVGGARAVDADQHVGAPLGGDLGECRLQDRDVIGGGERAGIVRCITANASPMLVSQLVKG
jgi:hypothetical protein